MEKIIIQNRSLRGFGNFSLIWIKCPFILTKKESIILLNSLYTILESNFNQIIVKLGNKEHPVFKAHFPEQPILPGFLQIDIISEILNDEILQIKYGKFIAHIYPDDEIIYNVKIKDRQKTIMVQRESKKISEIRYESK